MTLTRTLLLLLLTVPLGCREESTVAARPSTIASPETSETNQRSRRTKGPEVTEGESEAYREAYSLLFDTESRARKAIELLIAGKELTELGERELNLLCWAYNELHDYEKQLEASRHLWELYPDGETSTHWICASLNDSRAFAKNTSPVLDFISQALAEGKGNARDLLTLKACVLVAAKDMNQTDAERRVAVSDLLVQAYCSGLPSSAHFKTHDYRIVDSPDIFENQFSLREYFTSDERDALKLRMKRANEKAKADSVK